MFSTLPTECPAIFRFGNTISKLIHKYIKYIYPTKNRYDDKNRFNLLSAIHVFALLFGNKITFNFFYFEMETQLKIQQIRGVLVVIIIIVYPLLARV